MSRPGPVSLLTMVALAIAPVTSRAAAAPSGSSSRVSYEIQARLDERTHTVTGTERIVYRNQSADTLHSIWLHLHPRAFRSRNTRFARELEAAGCYNLAWADRSELGDITVTRLESGGAQLSTRIEGTEMEVTLARPLGPGDSTILTADFTLRIPRFFAACLGRRGRFHVFAGWHPQVAARGENGWHTGGIHPAARAPAQPGDYVVTLSLPADLVVAATGSLVDGNEELTWMTWPPEFRNLMSDTTKTLTFTARDVAEFAWVAAPDFVVSRDSARTTKVSILARSTNRVAWLRIPEQVRAIIDEYAEWYGPPPASDIAVLDATGITPADASYPGLVVISQRSIPFTRLQEKALARQLAFQWFSGPADQAGSSWLSTGPAVWSEIRYLEQRHGTSNLLNLPIAGPLAGLSDAYYHQAIYYIAASNHILRPLASPEYQYTTNPFSYSEARFSQAGGFFLMLQRILGPEALDRALRSYRQTDNRTTADFIAACTRVAGRDMTWLFDRWLNSTGTCDYAVTGAGRNGTDIEVGIRRVGEIVMPVDVEFTFTDGTRERRTWNLDADEGVIQLYSPKRLRKVTLDPNRKLLEPDRWNNYWPRQVDIRPVFALPSFDAYQLFYGPYAWYDAYHGFQLAGWAMGRQFFDTGPLRGRHMWTLVETYSTKLNDWNTSAWYQTPLPFISHQMRLMANGKYSLMAAAADISLVQGLSPVFRQAGATVEFGYQFLELRDLQGRDLRAWEKAKTGELKLRFQHTYETKRFKGNQLIHLGRGASMLGGDYDYWKTSIEQTHTFRLSRARGITLRGFVGAIPGDIPKQNRFYLSGGLVAGLSEPISWGYEGPASGQEHWHFDGGANCRGFAGDYECGRFAYALNAHLHLLPFVLPFFDIGNVGDDPSDPGFRQPRMDAGVRLKLGPLYADFPLWRYRLGGRHEFAPNWMIGLNLAGVGDF